MIRARHHSLFVGKTLFVLRENVTFSSRRVLSCERREGAECVCVCVCVLGGADFACGPSHGPTYIKSWSQPLRTRYFEITDWGGHPQTPPPLPVQTAEVSIVWGRSRRFRCRGARVSKEGKVHTPRGHACRRHGPTYTSISRATKQGKEDVGK